LSAIRRNIRILIGEDVVELCVQTQQVGSPVVDHEKSEHKKYEADPERRAVHLLSESVRD
jgi:hypothetical protein